MIPPVGIRQLKNKASIEAILRRRPELHIYSLGDLDDFFWPYTTWYGWEAEAGRTEVVLVYKAQAVTTVVGISERPAAMRELLAAAMPLLPERFYTHLSPGVEDIFAATHQLDSHGLHDKMALRDTAGVRSVDCAPVVPLRRQDVDDLAWLYRESYPGNWFDARMLETGQYFGLRLEGRLISAAGVHVYSARYRVAALGNIVTHPAHRNRGYAGLVTARLCQSLLQTVDHIGLNVKANNAAAISCYRKLGFEFVASYGEFMIQKRPDRQTVAKLVS